MSSGRLLSLGVMLLIAVVSSLSMGVAFAQPSQPHTEIIARHEIPILIKTNALSETTTVWVVVESHATISGTEIISSSTRLWPGSETDFLSIELDKITTTWALVRPPTQVITTATAPTRLGSVAQNANLRAGPSTNATIIGQLQAGDAIQIIGENDDGAWLQLDNGAWIAAFLVTESASTTPSLTVSALPSPTPYPLTGLEQRYMRQVKEKFTLYLPTLRDFQNALSLPQQDPSRLNDKAWITEVTGYALLISVFSKGLQELLPPARLRDSHLLLEEGLTAFDAATGILLFVGDSLSAEEYNTVRSQMRIGIAKITEALKLQDDFEGQFGTR